MDPRQGLTRDEALAAAADARNPRPLPAMHDAGRSDYLLEADTLGHSLRDAIADMDDPMRGGWRCTLPRRSS